MPLNNKPECHYHDAYANLAAAIIHSGELQHDIAFLHSNWCDILKKICILDDEMYGGRNIGVCVGSFNSINKIKEEH